MKKFKYYFLIVIFLFSVSVFGHHSFTSEFTAETIIKLQGSIQEVWFKNPHVRYLLLRRTPDNNEEIWDLRGSPVVWLARKGWTKNSINVGDKIIVEGYPGRDGRRMLSIIKVTLKDGSILIDRAPE
ncbi:MAG TPA: DUF6152 family protein [Woeseiaceae bacterium]|nr:DUF6152 family protein [Woeseiaceae bacterium]|tara:strand:+ start:4756 stop:5136 length:381 start_codon:yes stop_codon:yes gene_type:complete